MRKKGAAAKVDKNPSAINPSDLHSSDLNPPEKKSSKKLPIEEMLILLDDVDKAYIRGYIDRALLEQKRKPRKNK